MSKTLDVQRLGLWPTRLIWLSLPLSVGAALRNALTELADGPLLFLEIVGWILWFGGLVALLIPSPLSLTVTRTLAPAIVGTTVVVALATGTLNSGLAIGFVVGMLTSALLFVPGVGDLMVNGSAYGSERRMTLRPPGFAIFGPIQVAWLAIFGSMIATLFAIGTERFILAAALAVATAGVVWAAGRVLHQFTRRWIVFVPAGFVIHDPLMLVDAILLRRSSIRALAPARVPDPAADWDSDNRTDDVVDITGGALGLALEVETKQPTTITVRTKKTSEPMKDSEVTNMIFTPSLPGALLQEARIRGVKIEAVN